MKKIILIVIGLIVIGATWFGLEQNKSALSTEAVEADQPIAVLPVKVERIEHSTPYNTYKKTAKLVGANELIVLSEAQGNIISIYKKPGEFVSKGDLVALVNAELLEAESLVLKANLEKAEKDLTRYKSLFEKEAITKDQFEKINLGYKVAESKYLVNQKRLNDTRIRAPFSGKINKIFTQEGSLIGPGKPVFEIIDTESMEMKISLTEEEVTSLNEIEKITVQVVNKPELTFEAQITSEAVKANLAGQYDVVLTIETLKDNNLKSGLSARAIFQMSTDNEGIYINEKWIVDDKVFLAEDDKVKEVTVKRGKELEGLVQIKNGLKSKDLIITTITEGLKSGQRIRIINDNS
ncbi:MAG: efflux RND transporter periplasmic adaptor subunit [Bacteroidota bacterium]